MIAKYRWVLTGVVSLTAVSGLFLLERSRREHDVQRLERKVQALAADRALSQADPTGTASAIQAAAWGQLAAVAARANAHAQTEPPSPSAAEPATGVAEPPRTASDVRDSLNVEFESQPPEARNWGGQSRNEARAKLSALLPEGSTIRSFECHAALCKIETTHADLQAYTAFARSAFMDGTSHVWNAPFFITRADSGGPSAPPVMVAYIAQPGAQLPGQDEAPEGPMDLSDVPLAQRK
jgi:hypothetical protein